VPATRDVAPYLLVYASGSWYVLGHDADRDAVRTFRMDRMLHVDVTLTPFDVPVDFDATTFITGRGVYRSTEGEVEVSVRYSPKVARWIKERMPVELQADGSVIARHLVGDPTWIVRHVLQYGADACLIDTPELRERDALAAQRLSA
jgi:predicted DNA-binding transcriptional regulator YafY